MRKLPALGFSMLLVLTACMPVYDNNEEVVQETAEDSQRENAVIANHTLSDNRYPTLFSESNGANHSKARGVINRQISNRLDIDELETGLRRHSKEYFSPENYYFQPGQYLDQNTVYSWLERYEEGETEKGLNPALEESTEGEFRDNPRYLSHILEQNYMQKNEDDVVELKGASIGLALKSTYEFQTETGGPTYEENISREEMIQKGKEYAQQVLDRMREIEGLQDKPLMIALYREESSGAMTPGNFVMKTYVEGGATQIGEWEELNEDHILFPSDEAEEDHFEDSELMSDFRNELSKYFPDFVGFIGDGFYVDKELQNISIDVPIQFNSKSEVIGFTQYTYSLVKDMFENYYDVEINIKSKDRQESLIVKKAGEEEPFVHIYD
ncbi:CamS family sex pheromone protein [Thalassobacillus sp. CUG 92003]|uniref:CamS family sex pheromone protein n=1 Tax=Thalassobacillus sp. CUG 92003 TaxID=2736641 RepID=UPI0015E65DCA|nr:CamS family sex pheromone protein [Thalassobacillus sp. CUG 92003]